MTSSLHHRLLQVLFNVLFSLGGEFDVVQVVVNPCVGVVIMLLAMYAAMKFWPRFINGVSER
jgi:hypothetical protein